VFRTIRAVTTTPAFFYQLPGMEKRNRVQGSCERLASNTSSGGLSGSRTSFSQFDAQLVSIAAAQMVIDSSPVEAVRVRYLPQMLVIPRTPLGGRPVVSCGSDIAALLGSVTDPSLRRVGLGHLRIEAAGHFVTRTAPRLASARDSIR
jgi:hypothetical protein